MEIIATFLIPAVLTVILLRVLLMPAKLALKVAAHSACGLACLWMLNLAAPFSGVFFQVNAITVLVAGFLGLPGMGILAILAAL